MSVVHRPTPSRTGLDVGIRAVRTVRPDESYVVGEIRPVERIVEEKSRRNTDACMLDRACPSVDLGVGDPTYQCDRWYLCSGSPPPITASSNTTDASHVTRPSHPAERRLARRTPSPTDENRNPDEQSVGDGVIHNKALADVPDQIPPANCVAIMVPPNTSASAGTQDTRLRAIGRAMAPAKKVKRENRRSYTNDPGKFGCGVTR